MVSALASILTGLSATLKVGLEATEAETAHHDISFLAGEPQVQFRIFFASDGSVNWYDGFAFDNFKIVDPFPDDIGVINIAAPFSAPDLSAAESITVEIENFGTLSQNRFPVSSDRWRHYCH